MVARRAAASHGRRPEVAVRVRVVAVVGPGHVEVAVPVDRDRHRRELRHAVTVRRETLPSGTSGCSRPEGMRPDQAADAERPLPVGRVVAVLARPAPDHQHLADPRLGRVAVAEDDVDRPIRADTRVRALILVAGVRIAGRAAEVGAERGRPSVDDHLRRPGGAAVGGLAEDDRAATADRRRVRLEPGPRHVDTSLLGAGVTGVSDHQLLVVEDVLVRVVRRLAHHRGPVLLERVDLTRLVVHAALQRGVRLRDPDRALDVCDVEEDACDVRVPEVVERAGRVAAGIRRVTGQKQLLVERRRRSADAPSRCRG